jgi:transposase
MCSRGEPDTSLPIDAGDQRAALPLAAYKKIYKIEEEIREHDPPLKYAQVLAVRVEKIKPVFDELVAWCRAHQAMLPSSKLGTAIRYMLNHHVALGRFLTDGVIPIDNGPAERLHVRCAIARKNFLFAGSDDGGERAAVAFTILGSCRLVGVDPLEYLADVLPILTRNIRLADMPALLPVRWKARRDAATSAQ